MSTNKIVRFVLAGTTAGLMLAGASSISFAGTPLQIPPRIPPHKPLCGPSCQSNKAIPPTKLQPAKSTGAPNAGGKNLRQR